VVDISGRGHLGPRNIRVPRLHVRGEPARRFGNNLQSPRHRIEDKLIVAKRLVIETGNEGAGEVDLIADVKKPLPRVR
jgi:hypothetical protein